MQGYFVSIKIQSCSSRPQSCVIGHVFSGVIWPSSDRDVGTENDVSISRMLRALKVGGTGDAIRKSRDCSKVESMCPVYRVQLSRNLSPWLSDANAGSAWPDLWDVKKS